MCNADYSIEVEDDGHEQEFIIGVFLGDAMLPLQRYLLKRDINRIIVTYNRRDDTYTLKFSLEGFTQHEQDLLRDLSNRHLPPCFSSLVDEELNECIRFFLYATMDKCRSCSKLLSCRFEHVLVGHEFLKQLLRKHILSKRITLVDRYMIVFIPVIDEIKPCLFDDDMNLSCDTVDRHYSIIQENEDTYLIRV